MNTVIIPQKGQEHLTKRTVRHLRKFDASGLRIIVVNDGEDMVPIPEAEVVQNDGDGVTAAWNTGIRLTDCGSSILLLNNDVEIHGSIMQRIPYPDCRSAIIGASDRVETSLGKDSSILVKSRWLEGWFMYLHPEVWNNMPQFDESMKLYFSDLDYQQTAIKRGFDCIVTLVETVRHLGQQTSSAMNQTERQSQWVLDRDAFIRKWKK